MSCDVNENVCLICGYKTTEELELKSHLKLAHGSVANSCPFCPFSTENNEELQTHVATLHSDELKTPTKNNLNSEASQSSECLESSCPICDLKYEADFLAQHIELHFLSNENEDINTQNSQEPSCSKHLNCESVSKDATINTDAMMAKQLDFEEMHRMQEEKFSKHKAEELELKMLREKYNFNPGDKENFKSQAFKNLEKIMGRKQMTSTEYFDKKFTMLEKLSEGIDDGLTSTPNLIPQLKALITTSNDSVLLACGQVVHYSSGYGDSGWGCGYRNVQMLLSSLVDVKYKELLNKKLKGNIPSIPKLQSLIESAWGSGFDPRGRQQLEDKLSNTRKWIGATEVFSLLSSLGFHCEIVDFHKYSNQADKSHPLLFKWILDYFQNSLNGPDLPVLYLQHDGHSRSIVGVLLSKNSNLISHLVMFDPGISKQKIQYSLKGGKNSTSLPKLFLKKTCQFKHLQYQIVAVLGIASQERFEIQKKVDNLSTRIP